MVHFEGAGAPLPSDPRPNRDFHDDNAPQKRRSVERHVAVTMAAVARNAGGYDATLPDRAGDSRPRQINPGENGRAVRRCRIYAFFRRLEIFSRLAIRHGNAVPSGDAGLIKGEAILASGEFREG